MKLSIIIVNWNTRDYLLGALQSIYADLPDGGCEVIVVDNGSCDGSAQAAATAYPQVRLIANSENVGYARANNQGMRVATGEYVLLLNPDVVVPRGAIRRAIQVMEAEPDIGVLAAKLVHPDGRVQDSIRGFPTPWSIACEVLGLARLAPRSRLLSAYRMRWFDYDERSDVDQPMGTFLLMRRAVLDRVGLMDERFPIFFNDVDWCYRARKLGVRIVYEPSVELLHYGGGSTRLVAPQMAWESRRGLLVYLRKHYPSPGWLPALWITAAASYIYALVVSWRRKAGRE